MKLGVSMFSVEPKAADQAALATEELGLESCWIGST